MIVEITLNLSSARGKRMTGKEYQNLAMRTNDHKNSDRIIKKINNNQLVNSDELIIPDIGGRAEWMSGARWRIRRSVRFNKKMGIS